MLKGIVMPELEHKKERQINIRVKKEFLEEVDKYWPAVGNFTNRSEFIIYLLTDELKNRWLMTEEREAARNKMLGLVGEIKEGLARMNIRLSRVEGVKRELGETLEEHSPQSKKED